MEFLVWFLLALPLALDVFAAGLIFGLAGLERPRWLSMALIFAAIGGTMIAGGVLLGNAMEGAVGTAALYVAAIVLLAIGLRGLLHGLQAGPDLAVPPLTTRKIVVTAVATNSGINPPFSLRTGRRAGDEGGGQASGALPFARCLPLSARAQGEGLLSLEARSLRLATVLLELDREAGRGWRQLDAEVRGEGGLVH